MASALNCKFIGARPSEQCGCPEEEWVVNSIVVLIHFEEDGTCHIVLDAGDWDLERFVVAKDIVELSQQAFTMIAGLPQEGRGQRDGMQMHGMDQE